MNSHKKGLQRQHLYQFLKSGKSTVYYIPKVAENSFLIKISKADLSVAEEGRLRQRLFFNWNMPRAVPHSSRGGGRLMAGHVEGTATD